MLAYVNGRFLPENEATISIFDRGFLYGDALFEVIRVYGGRLFLWDLHLQRWEAGCALLRLKPALTGEKLKAIVEDLLKRNDARDVLVRITLSRGIGTRGYSPKTALAPCLVITLHPAASHSSATPKPLKVVTSGWRLRNEDPLAAAKHSNKLLQVLARAEADDKGADEALLLNDRGEVVEGSSSNLFWISGNDLGTAPIQAGVLPGTTRAFVMELGRQAGMDIVEARLQPIRLLEMDGVFLTSTALEIAEAGQLNGKPLKLSPTVAALRKAFAEATRA